MSRSYTLLSMQARHALTAKPQTVADLVAMLNEEGFTCLSRYGELVAVPVTENALLMLPPEDARGSGGGTPDAR